MVSCRVFSTNPKWHTRCLSEGTLYLNVGLRVHKIYQERRDSDVPIISVEGRLEASENVYGELLNVILEILHDPLAPSVGYVILDLSKTEHISSDCIQMFQRINARHPLRFQNYSAFIGRQLAAKDLLQPSVRIHGSDLQ